ncbi:MAG: branched-chain amino acid ABC transporter permease [Rhodobacterales bacterium]|nr:branched-chain amino acid ABC transporter permease [Rhodobacterales bacterium]
MNDTLKNTVLFAVVGGMMILVGIFSGWNEALYILNMGLISAIMALGVNLQWGLAGLFNVGIMGFVAIGGLATILVTMPATSDAVDAGGLRIVLAMISGAATIGLIIFTKRKLPKSRMRALVLIAMAIVGFFVFRAIFDPAVDAIEKVNPASTGYLGGLGLPAVIAWPIGGLFAAGIAWLIGKTALGLRSDYLAIATLGIAEIILAVLKNEDWLSRGVKNVIGIPRPTLTPYEIDLQNSASFVEKAAEYGLSPIVASSIMVKLSYSLMFTGVLIAIFILAQLAIKSPWGRMMRAIRDNEHAAGAMGKNVTARHLQIFVLGSAIVGIAGAMMTTMDGQLTPGTYQPLRFTFLIWVMVIVGGSGNNLGSILGGFLIWFLWIQGEPLGNWLMQTITSGMADGSALKDHLLGSAAHMRLLTIGVILLMVLRFSPRGLIPEK